MSAIDTTFHWVRNPTILNSLATTYVSKRGSDTTGDGTAQNPYASLAKATSVASTNTNIMIDDGEWNEVGTSTSRLFHFWGNSNTKLYGFNLRDYADNSSMSNFVLEKLNYGVGAGVRKNFILNNTILLSYTSHNYYAYAQIYAYHCIIADFRGGAYYNYCIFENCIMGNVTVIGNSIFKNSIFLKGYGTTAVGSGSVNNCNFCGYNIPTGAENSINDTTTGQTFADYFNKYDASDLLKCDFTAKEGAANIGAGANGSTIGLNQGYTMYVDNSANDVFKELNGATLKNIAWDSNLNGYVLVQKERVCQGATSNTITLDSSASAVDDYYNNLFIGIVAGDGYGELFLISNYDGATKTATIDGTWTTTPTTNSIYTISGTILSAVKDLGKAIKVKRNWTFADNFTALTDGQWAEFMTHVEANGKQFPASCYSYEYSTDGVNFVQGQTADDLVSATNGENKVTDNIYGDCSANYNESTARNLVMRYIRVRVHIGFNID